MKTITTEQIQKYREYLLEEEKAKATIEKYLHDVLAFATWLDGRKVKKSVVLEYKQTLIKTYAPKSVNSKISSLNHFFECYKWFPCKIKTLKLQRQIFAEPKKELTKTEYERLLAAAKDKKNERLYLIMQTICATGIRVSELPYITYEAVYSGQAQIKLKGKIRLILLNKDLCRLLKKYMKRQGVTNGCVFVTKSGKPIERHAIWKSMKGLCDIANVSKDKVFPHNLRHLFARTFYNRQKDIVRLADILGHSSINTTRIYTIETGEKCRKQIERLGLVRMRT